MFLNLEILWLPHTASDRVIQFSMLCGVSIMLHGVHCQVKQYIHPRRGTLSNLEQGAHIKLFSQTPQIIRPTFQRPEIISCPFSATRKFKLKIGFGGHRNVRPQIILPTLNLRHQMLDPPFKIQRVPRDIHTAGRLPFSMLIQHDGSCDTAQTGCLY